MLCAVFLLSPTGQNHLVLDDAIFVALGIHPVTEQAAKVVLEQMGAAHHLKRSFRL